MEFIIYIYIHTCIYIYVYIYIYIYIYIMYRYRDIAPTHRSAAKDGLHMVVRQAMPLRTEARIFASEGALWAVPELGVALGGSWVHITPIITVLISPLN